MTAMTTDMDTAIVGGGLCGLALAQGLHESGQTWSLFEARDRFGGRILTTTDPVSGGALDLGPTWYWPGTEPLMSRLVADLGLDSFAQMDAGSVLSLTDPNEAVETVTMTGLHGDARRLVGGMDALVQALVQRLPAHALHLGAVLLAVVDRGDHLELQFQAGAVVLTVTTKRLVLALPPRLVEEKIRFDPPLDGQIREALRGSHTWMADQAKALVSFDRPFWWDAGQSGNAFVSHEQAVLSEIFDACDASGQHAALGGFFALSAANREAFSVGLSILVESQFVQVFGTEAANGRQYIQDWSREPWTCSSLDREAPTSLPEYGNPVLRRPAWAGRLHFGGSESASYGGGHMEGALEAAARIQRSLGLAGSCAKLSDNGACLARFHAWVAQERGSALDRYRRHLNRDLAAQQKQQLTQRAVLAAVEQVYSEALAQLDGLPLDTSQAPVERGRCSLTPEVLDNFKGFSKELLDQVLDFNRTSCALSNFPQEHQPERDYLEATARDLAAAWVEFALGVNRILLDKADATV